MARGQKNDRSLLQFALAGIEAGIAKLQAQAAQIRRALGIASSQSRDNTPSSSRSVAPARRKRTMSAAARRRISAAQKARWARHREATTASRTTTKASGEAPKKK